ncbi:MAG: transglutaminase domain-containing protein [Myxococcota bacterium]|nr:transglutaminase domain-containing protein [Myxococcota bacterium]
MRRSITAVGIAVVFYCAGLMADARHEGDQALFEARFTLTTDKAGGLAYDGALLWISDRVAQKIRGLDPRTGEEKITLPAPGPWPTGLAFDGKLLWVGDRTRARLFGVDTRRKLVVRDIESPANPLGLAFDGTFLWVADGKQIHQVTTEDGTTITTFNAPAFSGEGRGSEQLGLAFSDGYLWISDRNQDKIYRAHPKKGDVVDMIPSPGPLPAGLAVTNGTLWVADVDARQVHALRLSTLPRMVRRNPRQEVVVLQRRITNQGPGVLKKASVYVAVPESGPGQALAGEPVYSHPPKGFVSDQWGQRFAHFEATDLGTNEALTVTMTVRATLFDVDFHLDPQKVGSLRDIPKAVKKQYLVDASKFALTHPSIKTHLKAALGKERRPYWMVRKIARYIQDQMTYELVGGWNIAPTVIDRGTGSCSEYTFVFIAMCRAAGIPARYVGAVVVRGDDASTDEVFHRWPEVYLPGYGWVPYDVQAGDKPTPEQQGAVIGSLPNRFIVTTKGGGASEYIHWDYNSYAEWICAGRCDVSDVHLGDWYPEGREPQKP